MKKGRYGIYGGQYISETLMNELIHLEEQYEYYKKDPAFQEELHRLLVKLLRHPDTGIKSETRQLLNQLTVMIHDGHILWAEIGNLPLVAQAK